MSYLGQKILASNIWILAIKIPALFQGWLNIAHMLGQSLLAIDISGEARVCRYGGAAVLVGRPNLLNAAAFNSDYTASKDFSDRKRSIDSAQIDTKGQLALSFNMTVCHVMMYDERVQKTEEAKKEHDVI